MKEFRVGGGIYHTRKKEWKKFIAPYKLRWSFRINGTEKLFSDGQAKGGWAKAGLAVMAHFEREQNVQSGVEFTKYCLFIVDGDENDEEYKEIVEYIKDELFGKEEAVQTTLRSVDDMEQEEIIGFNQIFMPNTIQLKRENTPDCWVECMLKEWRERFKEKFGALPENKGVNVSTVSQLHDYVVNVLGAD